MLSAAVPGRIHREVEHILSHKPTYAGALISLCLRENQSFGELYISSL